MALIKYGPGIVDARGSVAGVVFSKNATSHYMRARTIPVNPRTAHAKLARDPEENTQAIVRATMAFLTDEWSQTLTAANRTAWELYATNVVMNNKLGESIKLSGFNHFLRGNAIRVQNGQAIVAGGPVIFEIPEQDPTIVVEPEMHEQKCRLTFDDTMLWVDEDQAALYIFEGTPQNPQRNFFGGPYLGLKDKAGNSGAPKTSPEWFTNIHFLNTGQKVWYRFRIGRADGRLSESFYAHGIVVAGPI